MVDSLALGAFFLLPQEQIARVSFMEMFNERFVALCLHDTDAIADAHGNVVARELQMDSDRDLDIAVGDTSSHSQEARLRCR